MEAGKWGIWSEDGQNVFQWLSSDRKEDRGRFQLGRLAGESGPAACCDSVDNDLNKKTDCEEQACGSIPCCRQGSPAQKPKAPAPK
jgi:hypothetical protein